MQILAQPKPPQILQIYRDRLKPQNHAAYDQVERDSARVCAELGFPHAYLGIEPLMGPEEVWFLNGWESDAEQKQVADDYTKNARLVEALHLKAAGLRLRSIGMQNGRQASFWRPWKCSPVTGKS